MKTIQLTQNQVALVDDADFEWLNQWRWYAYWARYTHSFYARRNIQLPNGKKASITMHRLLLGLEHGDKRQGDHINHNTLDNRRCNLRIVSPQENAFNHKNPRGYCWSKQMQKYLAQIKVNGNSKYLGYFDDPTKARQAYLAAKVIHHKIRVAQ